MATSASQACELIDLAASKRRVLMVDHTFLYTGAVRKIRQVIRAGELGELLYFDSTRINLGLFRKDANVIWDLAPHDFSIMDHLLDAEPVEISAHGVSHLNTGLENMAVVIVRFAGTLIAHFHFNWLAPVKVRNTLIGGSNKMVVYNDLETDEKVKIYSKSVAMESGREGIYKPLYDYRTGDMHSPKVDLTEALRNVCQEFVECVQLDRRPLTDGEAGLRVIRLLETANESLRCNGAPIRVAR